eukprot:167894_1
MATNLAFCFLMVIQISQICHGICNNAIAGDRREHTRRLKIMSYNVEWAFTNGCDNWAQFPTDNWGSDNTRAWYTNHANAMLALHINSIGRYIQSQNADIVMVQEVCDCASLEAINAAVDVANGGGDFGYRPWIPDNQGDGLVIGMLTRVDANQIQAYRTPERGLRARIPLFGRQIQFYGVHFTAGNDAQSRRPRDNQARELYAHYQQFLPDVVVMGDFNGEKTESDTAYADFTMDDGPATAADTYNEWLNVPPIRSRIKFVDNSKSLFQNWPLVQIADNNLVNQLGVIYDDCTELFGKRISQIKYHVTAGEAHAGEHTVDVNTEGDAINAFDTMCARRTRRIESITFIDAQNPAYAVKIAGTSVIEGINGEPTVKKNICIPWAGSAFYFSGENKQLAQIVDNTNTNQLGIIDAGNNQWYGKRIVRIRYHEIGHGNRQVDPADEAQARAALNAMCGRNVDKVIDIRFENAQSVAHAANNNQAKRINNIRGINDVRAQICFPWTGRAIKFDSQKYIRTWTVGNINNQLTITNDDSPIARHTDNGIPKTHFHIARVSHTINQNVGNHGEAVAALNRMAGVGGMAPIPADTFSIRLRRIYKWSKQLVGLSDADNTNGLNQWTHWDCSGIAAQAAGGAAPVNNGKMDVIDFIWYGDFINQVHPRVVVGETRYIHALNRHCWDTANIPYQYIYSDHDPISVILHEQLVIRGGRVGFTGRSFDIAKSENYGDYQENSDINYFYNDWNGERQKIYHSNSILWVNLFALLLCVAFIGCATLVASGFAGFCVGRMYKSSKLSHDQLMLCKLLCIVTLINYIKCIAI